MSILVPILGSAQTTAPIISNLPNVGQALSDIIPAPVSGFIDQLKTILQNGVNAVGNGQALSGGGNGLNLSNAGDIWNQINDWFSSNIGVSFTDIVKAVVNLIIWIWELIIKLIQVGLSKL